jgi:hypothetical protein
LEGGVDDDVVEVDASKPDGSKRKIEGESEVQSGEGSLRYIQVGWPPPLELRRPLQGMMRMGTVAAAIVARQARNTVDDP